MGRVKYQFMDNCDKVYEAIGYKILAIQPDISSSAVRELVFNLAYEKALELGIKKSDSQYIAMYIANNHSQGQ